MRLATRLALVSLHTSLLLGCASAGFDRETEDQKTTSPETTVTQTDPTTKVVTVTHTAAAVDRKITRTKLRGSTPTKEGFDIAGGFIGWLGGLTNTQLGLGGTVGAVGLTAIGKLLHGLGKQTGRHIGFDEARPPRVVRDMTPTDIGSDG